MREQEGPMVPVEKLVDAAGVNHTDPDTLKARIEAGDLRSVVDEEQKHGNVVGFDFSHVPGKVRTIIARHPWQVAGGAAVVGGAIYIWEHRKKQEEERRAREGKTPKAILYSESSDLVQ